MALLEPPGATGSIYRPEALLVPDGNHVNPADTATISDYQSVPVQEEAANGPQPISGMSGATDSGPCKVNPGLGRG